jgi:hypothetical protein
MEIQTESQHFTRLANANRRLQTSIRTRAEIQELLDRFWAVQDELGRFLQAADKTPWLTTQVPGLSSAIFNEIRSVSSLKSSRVAAIQNACESINQLLIRLEKLKEDFQHGFAQS